MSSNITIDNPLGDSPFTPIGEDEEADLLASIEKEKKNKRVTDLIKGRNIDPIADLPHAAYTSGHIEDGPVHLSKWSHHLRAIAPSGANASHTLTTFNLAKSWLGVGVLCFPFVMRLCGVIPGLIICTLVYALSVVTVSFLMQSADLAHVVSYEDVVNHYLGANATVFLDILIIGRMWGGLIGYFCAVRDIVADLCLSAGFDEASPTGVLIILSILTVIPLSMRRNLNSLRYTTIIATLLMIVTCIGVLIEFLAYSLANDKWHGSKIELWPKNWGIGVLRGLPLVVFSMSQHPTFFPIRVEMLEPTLDNFNKAVRSAIIMSSFVQLMFGVFGYLTFVDETDGNIMKNYGHDVLSILMKISVMINCIFTMPVIARPVVIAVDYLAFTQGWAIRLRWRRSGSGATGAGNADMNVTDKEMWLKSHTRSVRRHYVESFIVVTFALIISISAGSGIFTVLAFTGSLTATALCMILPSIIYVKSRLRRRLNKILALVIMIFGVFILISSFVTLIIYGEST